MVAVAEHRSDVDCDHRLFGSRRGLAVLLIDLPLTRVRFREEGPIWPRRVRLNQAGITILMYYAYSEARTTKGARASVENLSARKVVRRTLVFVGFLSLRSFDRPQPYQRV